MPNHPHAKLILGILHAPTQPLPSILRQCELVFGEVELQSAIHPFDLTDYYQAEMGQNLQRVFVSFKGLLSLENSARLKQQAVELEEQFKTPSGRTVNLDPGYVDQHKVVLLTGKPGAQKIYLGNGVWADMLLKKHNKVFQSFVWTFPDLRGPEYHEFFLQVGRRLKQDYAKLQP